MAANDSLANRPGNSNASKEAASRMAKVAAGRKKELKKRSKIMSIGDALFNSDDRPKTDITKDIVEPALKNTLLDIISAITGAITDAFAYVIFDGDIPARSRRDRKSSDRFRNGYIDYSAHGGSEDKRRSVSRASRELQDFSEVDFDTWEEANDVLTNMRDLLNRYEKYVTVADFYALSGVSYSYNDRTWGWTDLSKAYPIRDGSSYILVLPKPVSLK